MRRVVTLIRHGLTDWNVSGRFQGQSDRSLSADGRRQARLLAQRMSRLADADLIVSSPLGRALETAELAFPGRAIERDARLMELDFGAFQGLTIDENRSRPEWDAWVEDPFGTPAPGGESYRQLRDRAVDWYESLPHDAAHVIAVTHSGTIQMILAHVLGIEYPRWRKRIYVRHSSVSRLVGKNGDVVIERVNDTRHLDEDGADPFWE